MKVIFHGKFAQDYGREHNILAKNIYEAVEALTRQLKFYADRLIEDRPVAKIVGYDTQRSLEENPEVIHIVPAIAGGKGAGKILVGAALIGLSFVVAPASPFLASVLFNVGVSLALSGIVQLFIKAPTLSGQQDPEASQYLGLANNTTKVGTLRPYSMGTIKVTAAHLLALNVDSSDLIRGEFPT